MSKVTMDEAIDEILTGKKKKKKAALKETETNVQQIIEQDDEEEDKSNDESDAKSDDDKSQRERDEEKDNMQDAILKVDLYINDNEDSVELSAQKYERKAITDFLSLLSLFKNSSKVDVKQFLDSVGLGSDQGSAAAPQPPENNAQGMDVSDTGEEGEQAQSSEEEFQLTSFGLTAEEQISQSGENSVSIVGEENINGMLSFKVSVGEDSTPFNTPQPALTHFNNAFFNNIIQIIDKEMEKRKQ